MKVLLRMRVLLAADVAISRQFLQRNGIQRLIKWRHQQVEQDVVYHRGTHSVQVSGLHAHTRV